LPQWASFAVGNNGPLLPPVDRASLNNGTVDPRGALETDPDVLDRELQFTREADGVLRATGRIVQGSANAFESALARASQPVRAVVIDSPGGSLEDAMAMGRLARERQLAIEVKDGGVCASSCPLFLAGGVERTIGAKAAIGLHQFYATTGGGNGVAAALSSAQATAARIGHHLVALDVDPALWLHAFETPPQTLYYLTPDQQARYRLSTRNRNVVAEAGR
jgi:hypothetical protein